MEAILLLLEFYEGAVGGHDVFDKFQASLLAVFNGTAQSQGTVFTADIISTVEFTHAIQVVVQKCFIVHFVYHLSFLYVQQSDHFSMNVAICGQDFIFFD